MFETNRIVQSKIISETIESLRLKIYSLAKDANVEVREYKIQQKVIFVLYWNNAPKIIFESYEARNKSNFSINIPRAYLKVILLEKDKKISNFLKQLTYSLLRGGG